jgi:hypothetical protein
LCDKSNQQGGIQIPPGAPTDISPCLMVGDISHHVPSLYLCYVNTIYQ